MHAGVIFSFKELLLLRLIKPADKFNKNQGLFKFSIGQMNPSLYTSVTIPVCAEYLANRFKNLEQETVAK